MFKYGKIRIRKNSVFGHFSRSDKVRAYRQHRRTHTSLWKRLFQNILVFSDEIRWQNLRRAYETKFQTEYKIKLNQLWQIKGMTQRFNVLLITFRNTPTRDHHFLVRFYVVTRGNFHVWDHRNWPVFQVFLHFKLV